MRQSLRLQNQPSPNKPARKNHPHLLHHCHRLRLGRRSWGLWSKRKKTSLPGTRRLLSRPKWSSTMTCPGVILFVHGPFSSDAPCSASSGIVLRRWGCRIATSPCSFHRTAWRSRKSTLRVLHRRWPGWPARVRPSWRTLWPFGRRVRRWCTHITPSEFAPTGTCPFDWTCETTSFGGSSPTRCRLFVPGSFSGKRATVRGPMTPTVPQRCCPS